MSTVDPEMRWWRNRRVLRACANILWGIVFATTLVTGWSNALFYAEAEWTHWAGATWLTGNGGASEFVSQTATLSLVAVIPLVFIAGFVDGCARHRGAGSEAWALATAFGVSLSGLGLGALIAASAASIPWYWPGLFLLVGVACLVLRPVSARMQALWNRRQEWARINGTAAEAVVTKVDLVIIMDVPRSKATLRYDDHTGQTRWHTASTPHRGLHPKVGDRYTVRYDAAHPGRRSTIYVNLRKPKNTGSSR